MKRTLLIMGALLLVLQAEPEPQTPSVNFSVGASVGAMGQGIYLRSYLDDIYLQATGLYSKSYSERDIYAGVSTGYYLFKELEASRIFIPYAITLVAGVNYANESGYSREYMTYAIGLGFEFFSPMSKGMMVGFSVDYGLVSDNYVGILATGTIGYNF